MNRHEVNQIFRDAFNGGMNFMTPTVIERRALKDLVYEISEGTGLSSEPIFGVTVLTKQAEHKHELCKLFYSLEEAKEYVESL
jgi:hypothetical protein